MKKYSKKNIKKTKVSKKNKNKNKNKLQKGGAFTKENIDTIREIMQTITITGGYQQLFKKVYQQLSMKFHPDRNFSSPDDIKQKYETYFKIINDFNMWVNESSLKNPTWIEAIELAERNKDDLNSTFSSNTNYSSSYAYSTQEPPPDMNINIEESLKKLEMYYYDHKCNKPYFSNEEIKFEDTSLDLLSQHCIKFNPEKRILNDITIKLYRHFGQSILYISIKDLYDKIKDKSHNSASSSHDSASSPKSASQPTTSSYVPPSQESPPVLTLEEDFTKLQEYYDNNKCKYQKNGKFLNISFIDNILNNLLNNIFFSVRFEDTNPVFQLTRNIKTVLGEQFDNLKDKTIKEIFIKFNIKSKNTNNNSKSSSKSKLEKEREKSEKTIQKLIEEQIDLESKITKLNTTLKKLEEELTTEMANLDTINDELSKL